MPQYYNEDNLLKYFQEEILKASQKKIESLREEISYLKQTEMQRIETEVKESLVYSLGAELKEIEDQEIQTINQLNSNLLNRLSKFRDTLVDEVFQVVNEKIHLFVKTPDYATWINQKVKNIQLKYPKSAIYYTIMMNDLVMKQTLEPLNNGGLIEESPLILLGGFRVKIIDLGIEFDETFDSKLNEKRQWFYENSKLFVR